MYDNKTIQAKIKQFKFELAQDDITLARRLQIERETDSILDVIATEMARQIVAHRMSQNETQTAA